MSKVNKSFLAFLGLGIFLSGSINSYGSDDCSSEDALLEQTDYSRNWSIWHYVPSLPSLFLFSTRTEVEGERNIEVPENIVPVDVPEEMAEEEIPIVTLLHDKPPAIVCLYNANRRPMKPQAISLDSHFKNRDLIRRDITFGETIVSVYDGATYIFEVKGQRTVYSGEELRHAIYESSWPKDVVLMAVKKGDALIYGEDN